MTRCRPLHDDWTLRVASGEEVPAAIAAETIPATVPGTVHTDLLAAGLIRDPYVDAHENALTWIGRTDWRYATRFAGGEFARGAERVDLVCDGLDTVADIELNGAAIGSTRNMHRSYRFDVTGSLRQGLNDLTITFASAYAYAESVRDKLGDLPAAYPEPYAFIRKMACNFGWDWGPTLVTAGIWRPVRLEAWSVARIRGVRPVVTAAASGAGRYEGRVVVQVDIERSGTAAAGPLRVRLRVGEVTETAEIAAHEDTTVVEVRVPAVRRWWPRGYGDQPLYEAEVILTAADARPGDTRAVLDSWRRRVGFRTVRLDTTPDARGSRFTVVVNDVPVQVKGANWIPDDCFPHRVDRDRYAERIDQACSAHLNLLRVWGGGLYESEDFYQLCDERGVLVWQDFLFACAAYPEEPPIADEVEAEAREAVVRLMPHPSLVLWNGNNECVVGYVEWGWRPLVGERTWGRGYYLELLPAIAAELDPTRPYWPGSPYSGTFEIHPDDPGHGTAHIWDVWNERDYTAYRDHVPRFAAEFGYQGPAAYSTLGRAVSDGPLRPDSSGLAHHQKADDGHGKLTRGLHYHFPPPASFDDWHYLTQVNQARALALGVEHLRSHWPACAGSVIWQLNDCWPAISWSVVDGEGRLKPAWYALRRAYAERLLVIQPAGDALELVVVNDSLRPWRGAARICRRGIDGRAHGVASLEVAAEPRGVARARIPDRLVAGADRAEHLLTAELAEEAGARRAVWFFGEDTEIAYPVPEYDATVRERSGGLEVTVTARTLLRDLALLVDRLEPDAVVDDMLVTLLPGEAVTFHVHGGVRGVDALVADALVRPPVLRTVNDAVRASAEAAARTSRPRTSRRPG